MDTIKPPSYGVEDTEDMQFPGLGRAAGDVGTRCAK